MDQVPFSVTFPENPENRCPCLLLVDTSGSMAGQPIAELQSGLRTYGEELAADALAAKRVEVAIVAFGGTPRIVQNFCTVEAFVPPGSLVAEGETPMGQAINLGLPMLEQRKEEYRQNGIQHYRPWVFLFSDGAPTDMNTPAWAEALNNIRQGVAQKKFSFFAVGVEGANMEVLKQLSVERDPLKLKGLRFGEFFLWLSGSQSKITESRPGDNVPLENPAGPNGWAEVSV